MPEERLLLTCCAVLYFALALWISFGHRRPASLLLAACCVITSAWAAYVAWSPGAVPGVQGGADLLRAIGWYGFILFLYRDAQLGKPLHQAGFAIVGVLAVAMGSVALLTTGQNGNFPPSVFSLGIMARLGLAVAELLLIENLYFNLPEHARWHVALPSVLLGALACFDILLCADVVLFHHATLAVQEARTLGMIVIAPLLLVAASRGRRWKGKVKLSRTAAFHSATLILSGSVLIGLGVTGEVFRQVDANWGWLLELTLAFTAMIALGLLLTSAAARSRFQSLFIEHFFAERYDYRRQWLACIGTLSGADGDLQSALATRAIRTIVSVVDSPAGILFLRDSASSPFNWAGSWNMPATDAVPAAHPLAAAVQNGNWVALLDGDDAAALCAPPLDTLGALWLAVPLVHRGVLIGLVLSGLPRAPFVLEQEVFDLLRIVAQEVATYIAEQRATQTLLQTKDLHDYSKRFAFVAHDIKNVSSQLGLLLSNAESHIDNPEFQRDMLDTVRASVRKITALLQRLEQPETDRAPAGLSPVPRLEALVATYQRVRKVHIVLEHDGSTATVAIGADAFETAVTHLLNNAVEASASAAIHRAGRSPASDGEPAPRSVVLLRVRHEARQVVVDIVDSGPGMTPEFVRDKLFRPFTTSKSSGSGIGAYQSRELAQAAGGELRVISEPGIGTTMRLILPRTDQPGPANPRIAYPVIAGADSVNA